MKITRVEAIPVCVPLKKGMTAKTAHGEHVTSPYVVVRVHTDAGIIGLGEATISALWSGETQAGSVAAASAASAKAWQRQPPKSRLRSGQLRHGSCIQASPRKAFMPGASRQQAARLRSRTFQNSSGSSPAPWQGSARPSGVTTRCVRAQPPMHGLGRSRK